MADDSGCKIYIGNLDEKVPDRVLYEILIQVGRVVDLHVPRDKKTNSSKGYAFAAYENKYTADYAVRLFSGLVTLNNRTLKFAISRDKHSQNTEPVRQMLEQDDWSQDNLQQQISGQDRAAAKTRPWLAHLNGAVPSLSFPVHPFQYVQGFTSNTLALPNTFRSDSTLRNYDYNLFATPCNPGFSGPGLSANLTVPAPHQFY